MQKNRALFALVSAAMLTVSTLALSGCGDSPTGSRVTATPTPAPVTILLKQGGVPGIPVHHYYAVQFATASYGTISGTVDWTFPSNEVWIAVAAGKNTCVDANQVLIPSLCTFIISDTTPGLKPKTFNIPSQAAGIYTLYIRNRGPETESASFQVFQTS